MLCTSGFMDDVTFGRSGRYGDAWTAEPQPTTASGVAIPGRSLMSMNALLRLCSYSTMISVLAYICLLVCL